MKAGYVCIDGQYYAPNHPFVKSKQFVYSDKELMGTIKWETPKKKRIRQSSKPLMNKQFLAMLSDWKLIVPFQEWAFHPTRKWRFDYAWPNYKIALEVDGGIWTQGRHTRGSGRLKDMEKFNAAALLGWRILYVTPEQLCTQETVDMISKSLLFVP